MPPAKGKARAVDVDDANPGTRSATPRSSRSQSPGNAAQAARPPQPPRQVHARDYAPKPSASTGTARDQSPAKGAARLSPAEGPRLSSSSSRTSVSTSAKTSRNASKRTSRASSRPQSPAKSPSPSPGLPPPPTIGAPTDSDKKEIASHLSKKRFRGKFKSHSRSASADSGGDEGDTWTHKDILDAERAAQEVSRALRSKHVKLIVDGRAVHTEAGLGNATVPGRSYVWEVMYENQRGMTLFGKSWYSSNSLLPGDPTQFTLSSKLPETEVTESLPPTSARQTKRTKPKLVRDTLKTAYDLESYQTPSPAWVWMTPWMVNMRAQTDEQGWEYNLWFHQSSWRAHPGHLNWWGWVRRRQWVRLRSLVPEIIEKANEEMREADDDFWDNRHPTRHSSERSSPLASLGLGMTPSSRETGDTSRPDAPTPGMDWSGGDAEVGYLVRNLTKRDDEDAEASNSNASNANKREQEEIESDRSSTTTNASNSTAASGPADVSLALLLETADPVLEMVRVLALAPLDRQKLEALLKWIDEGEEADVAQLKDLLDDHENLEALARAFVFASSRAGMYDALTKRGLIPDRECRACTPSAEGSSKTASPG